MKKKWNEWDEVVATTTSTSDGKYWGYCELQKNPMTVSRSFLSVCNEINKKLFKRSEHLNYFDRVTNS